MKLKSPQLIATTFIFGMSLQAFAALDLSDYPKIYPFVPKAKTEIYRDVEHISEDKRFIKNFQMIVNNRLSKGNTTTKPWTGSYWPLSKGTIADSYEDNKPMYYLDTGWIIWKGNYRSFKSRVKNVLTKVDYMSEYELSRLAPSEKYDLLMGDKSFDLTKRLWEYMNDWGSKKMNAFITDLRLVDPDALKRAKEYLKLKFVNDAGKLFKNKKDIFKNYVEFQGALSVENSLKLVENGEFRNVTAAFPTALKMAKEQKASYELAGQSSFMAAWEGICNGWATAAGIVPRPIRAIKFKLKDGRQLKFYPADIRGLVSLFWVNSLIQNNVVRKKDGSLDSGSGGTLMVGKRCNIEAKEDRYGRLYDHEADPFNYDHSARCSGVHPATWHLGLVNLIGKQKRSFVVERKVGPAVDNHPMSGYEFKYYNPNTGKENSAPMANVVRIDKEDQFQNLRHKDARYIVGVEGTMTYLDYSAPSRQEKTSKDDDSDVDKTMLYDLELDSRYNIIGGQWRGVKIGKPKRKRRAGSKRLRKERRNHNQPDFFWAITKDWEKTKLFRDDTKFNKKKIAVWKNHTKAPPRSWLKVARSYHSFTLNQSYYYGNGLKCNMVHKESGEVRAVPCEKSTNRPQPFINVLNVLITRAAK